MGPNVKFISAITDAFSNNKNGGQFFSGKKTKLGGGALFLTPSLRTKKTSSCFSQQHISIGFDLEPDEDAICFYFIPTQIHPPRYVMTLISMHCTDGWFQSRKWKKYENHGNHGWFRAKEWKFAAVALPFIFGRTRQH